MMILQDAWDQVQIFLDAEIRSIHEEEIVVCTVTDHPKAWSFVYNSRKFLEDGDFLASLVGNGPIIVPKSGAPLFLASTAEPINAQVERL